MILFRVIADLKRQGVAIVYISHRLEELIRIGDYITVLRDGRITGHDRDGERRHAVDRPPDDRLRRQGFFAGRRSHVFGETVMRCTEVIACRAAWAVLPSTMSRSTLRAGEILGIYGLMGAGRSELFDCIMGRHGHATRHDRSGRRASDVSQLDTAGRIAAGLAHDPGGPPARWPGLHPLGRRQHDPVQPGSAEPLA